MLARVGAAVELVVLVLAVADLVHALLQDAVHVARQQRIPAAAPDHLQHVPVRAAERTLQLLDDLAVAPDGPVEALQVAVDHQHQVVELLACRDVDGAARAPITTTNTCKGNNWLLDSVALLTDDDGHSPDFRNHYLIAN